MKRKLVITLLAMVLSCSLFIGCGSQATGTDDAEFISEDVEDDDYEELTKSEETIKEYCSHLFNEVTYTDDGIGIFIKFENEKLPVAIIRCDGEYTCNYRDTIHYTDPEIEFAKEGFIKLETENELNNKMVNDHSYYKYEDGILLDEEEFYQVSFTDGKPSYYLFSKETNSLNHITEEEFNNFVSQYEWIRLDEIETWYDNFEEAYENMIILE